MPQQTGTDTRAETGIMVIVKVMVIVMVMVMAMGMAMKMETEGGGEEIFQVTRSSMLDCHVLKGFGMYMIGILDRLY